MTLWTLGYTMNRSRLNVAGVVTCYRPYRLINERDSNLLTRYYAAINLNWFKTSADHDRRLVGFLFRGAQARGVVLANGAWLLANHHTPPPSYVMIQICRAEDGEVFQACPSWWITDDIR